MDTYVSRLPHCLQVLDALLKTRGFAGHPKATVSITDLLTEALSKSTSLGSLLSVIVEKEGTSLGIAWVDPVFDTAKGREVMTSGYQLKNAVDKFKDKATCTLIICYAKLSPDAQRLAQTLGRSVQLLTCTSLAVSIKDHVVIPKHTALSEEQAAEFERLRNVKRAQLPMLRIDDAVVAWNNWPRGTIVKIDRPQGPFWRVVR